MASSEWENGFYFDQGYALQLGDPVLLRVELVLVRPWCLPPSGRTGSTPTKGTRSSLVNQFYSEQNLFWSEQGIALQVRELVLL